MPSEKEKPQIELYLYSLNQEFPVGKGHQNFLKRHSEVYHDPGGKLVAVEQLANQTFLTKAADDWSVQWLHNQWVENYTKVAGEVVARGADPLRSVIIRQEEFGGIVFDPTFDRVYKANKAGFRLFQEVQRAHQANRLDKFRSEEFTPEEVEPFVAFLKGAGLWKA